MNVICLDAEFADNEELLELSAFNLAGEEVYHSYYKPADISDFASCREEVQSLLDDAFALTGFAVDNDLRVLTRSGIKGLDKKPVIDVKDMYWLQRGKGEGMSPFGVPSLLVCSNALGLEFLESEAHSASADTEATLRCFNLLMDEFVSAEGVEGNDALTLMKLRIEEAKADFIEEGARGYVKIFKAGDLHKVKYGKTPESDRRLLILEVEVADRYKAEYEIRKFLKKKEIPDKHSMYKLTNKLIEEVGKYSNTYDAEESAWCKKVVRNLSRLTL